MDEKIFWIEDGVLKKYTGEEREVTIPAGVTKIGNRAFAWSNTLEVVVLPEGVTEIEGQQMAPNIATSAFTRCRALKKVVLPSSLQVIGGGAFSYCVNLEEINLPKGLTTIDWAAFSECERLKSVEFPESLTKIGYNAFAWCTSLKQVRVPNPGCVVEERAFAESGVEEAEIPVKQGVTSQFEDCQSLRRLKFTTELQEAWTEQISETQKVFHSSAYVELKKKPASLEVVEAPLCKLEDLGNVKAEAARGFAQLRTQGVEFSVEVEAEYEAYLKKQKKKLYPVAANDPALLGVLLEKKLVPADQVEEVTALAQGNEEALRLLQEYRLEEKKAAKNPMTEKPVTEKVKTAPKQNWKKLWKLRDVPEKFGGEPGNYIAQYCGAEIDVEFPAELDGEAVKGVSYRSAKVPENYLSVRSVALPDGYKAIGAQAFSGCSALKEIHLPGTLQAIGEKAFENCTQLQTVTIPNKVYQLSKGSFAGCTALKDVYILNPRLFFDKSVFKGCDNYVVHSLEGSNIQNIVGKKHFQAMTQEEFQKMLQEK